MKWKLVPVEPDEQQIYAMRSAFYRVRRGGAGGQTIDACYQRENAPELAAYSAMLETAPQPPALTNERIFEIATRFQDGGDFGWDTNMCEREQLGFARAIEREILGGSEK